MEVLIFGSGGQPLLVFPTSMGRIFDYEQRDMIGAANGAYETGTIQAFCIDSVDSESWYSKACHPRDCVLRHGQFLDEAPPYPTAQQHLQGLPHRLQLRRLLLHSPIRRRLL